jgi:predicted nucleic acid-binding protein
LTDPDPVLVSGPVVVEVRQLLIPRRGFRTEAAFLTSLNSGELKVIDLESSDYAHAAQLVEQYADLPLGTTDAAVITVAERYGEHEVATLDHRHFTVVRPHHVKTLTLLP